MGLLGAAISPISSDLRSLDINWVLTLAHEVLAGSVPGRWCWWRAGL